MATRESSTKLREGLELDPRYQQIVKELRDDFNQKFDEQYGDREAWSKDQYLRDKYLNEIRDYEDGTVEGTRDPSKETAKDRANKLFKERYEEDYKEYQEIEKKRVYSSADNDPTFLKFQNRISEKTNVAPEVESSSRQNLEENWNKAYNRESVKAWKDFAREYPEKAKAYAEKGHKGLSLVLASTAAPRGKVNIPVTFEQDKVNIPVTFEEDEFVNAYQELDAKEDASFEELKSKLLDKQFEFQETKNQMSEQEIRKHLQKLDNIESSLGLGYVTVDNSGELQVQEEAFEARRNFDSTLYQSRGELPPQNIENRQYEITSPSSGVGQAAAALATGNIGNQIKSEAMKQLGTTALGKFAQEGMKKLAGLASGLMSGGLGTALTAASMIKNWAKPVARVAAMSIAMASMLGSGLTTVTSNLWNSVAIALITVPLVITAFVVIINTGAYIVPIEYGGIFTEEDIDENIDASDCPLINGRLISTSWGSYNRATEIGHGSNSYWGNVLASGGACSYAQPQRTNCYAPTNPGNVCYSQKPASQRCPFYGYAGDFVTNSPPGVYLPKVNGQVVTWNYVYTFQNGSQGWTHVYSGNGGAYTIVFTHLNEDAVKESNLQSGTRIGRLFSWSRTHLHLEFQANGVYVKPENYFCK